MSDTKTRDDGGRAFPRPATMADAEKHYIEAHAQEGMTLRDYFAIHGPDPTDTAIREFLNVGDHGFVLTQQARFDAAAALRYTYADAMLEARER